MAGSPADVNEGERPNIVYIMADDMGYGDPGCFGATKIPTPNMDRLAEAGIRLTDAHSASAVCTPSRYAVMTGRYCWRTRLHRGVMWGFSNPLIHPRRTTVASLLKQHGYATAAIGKWHLGLRWFTEDGKEAEDTGYNVDYARGFEGGPLELGFDKFFGIAGSLDMRPYCFLEDDHTVGIPSVKKDPVNPQQREGLMTPGWRDEEVDTTFTEKATDFIEENADGPFFLYLTPSAPHRPCVPPDFMKGKSDAGPRGDMVCLVDWMVGQVVEKLEEMGVRENTLIIVTSDNGARLECYNGEDYGHKSCGNLRGQKADIWDGGHREPFIASWPGHIEPGTTSDETACLVDLLATVADITGDELPTDAAEDSVSFLPILQGEGSPDASREAIVHHSGWGMFSVRRGNWKMIDGLGSGGFSEPREVEPDPDGPKGQLYDMEADPQETENLWSENPELVKEMRLLLNEYRDEGRSVEREE